MEIKRKEEKKKEKMFSEETRIVDIRGYYQQHIALNQIINEKISKKNAEKVPERRESARRENMKSK